MFNYSPARWKKKRWSTNKGAQGKSAKIIFWKIIPVLASTGAAPKLSK